MIGYVTVNRGELKVKELGIYQAFYCGVCRDIKEKFGQIPRMTLSYEMTFLAMLLTSVYDAPKSVRRLKCLLHPAERRACIRNEFTSYAADMCLITSYHNLMDNWTDEKSAKSLVFARLIRNGYKEAAKRNKRQAAAVVKCIRETRKVEASGDDNIDLASGLTGHMLEEIFKYKEDDIWNRDLGRMGFYLGKFIYLMDAYDDLEEDIKNESYNPFAKMVESEDFEKWAKEILTMMAAEAAAALERLPVIDFIDIFRNILYSGIWAKYYMRSKGRDKQRGQNIQDGSL